MFKLGVLGRLPYSQSVEITLKKQKKDTNTWATYECGKASAATPEAIESAKEWIQIMKVSKYVVDDKAEKSDTDSETTTTGY